MLQDWGGLIGTRVCAAHPGAFRRLVIANTMMPTCDDSFFKVSPGFFSWKTFAFRTGLKDEVWTEERGGRGTPLHDSTLAGCIALTARASSRHCARLAGTRGVARGDLPGIHL